MTALPTLLPPGYELREGLDAVDFPRVTAWLAGTYWSPGISRDTVELAARSSSLVLSLYHVTPVASPVQVGYARAVSDRVSFGWIADVFVDPAHRGRGLARAMVAHAVRHPDYRNLRRWMLATRDAQGVYAPIGFHAHEHPERMMVYRPESDPGLVRDGTLILTPAANIPASS